MACCFGGDAADRFGFAEIYTLVRRVGRGGEGEVWLAVPVNPPGADARAGAASGQQAAAGAPVAIKLLRRGLSTWQVEAATAEVQCVLELGEGHCNILRPIELLLSHTHLGLVTEYVPGGSLSDYVRSRLSAGKPLSEAECSYFFRQLITALRFCHDRHIAYRDVKPDNVLLDDASPPTLRLCDFGVARRWADERGSGGMTTLTGTPGYTAPQVLGCMFSSSGAVGGYDGAAADVWSAGALLSQLLLQQLPYEFDSFAANTEPTAAMSRVWERAKSGSWRDNATPPSRSSGRLGKAVMLSPEVLDLLDRMLHPQERMRPTLQEVAQHPWVTQPLDEAHERALEALEEKQAKLKRKSRDSGVYSRTDGDGVIAAVVQRASAHESMREMAAIAADAENAASAVGGGDERGDVARRCIRLRLEDVPRMQCPPSLHVTDRQRGAGAKVPPPSPNGTRSRPRAAGGSATSSGERSLGGVPLPPLSDVAARLQAAQAAQR